MAPWWTFATCWKLHHRSFHYSVLLCADRIPLTLLNPHFQNFRASNVWKKFCSCLFGLAVWLVFWHLSHNIKLRRKWCAWKETCGQQVLQKDVEVKYLNLSILSNKSLSFVYRLDLSPTTQDAIVANSTGFFRNPWAMVTIAIASWEGG